MKDAAETANVIDRGVRTRLWLPALLGVAALAMEAYALFWDIGAPLRERTTNHPVIATYKGGFSEVRNRHAGTITWDIPQPGAALRRQDAVLTMSDSQAQIDFTDGAAMTVGPDSLVILEKTAADGQELNQKIIVKLVQGSLSKETAGTSPMSVDLAGTKIEDSNGDALFRLAKVGDAIEVHVEQGDLKVGTNGQVVSRSEKAVIQGDKVEIKKLPVRFSSLTPSDGYRVARNARDERLTLRWAESANETLASDFKPRVLVASSADMKDAREADVSDPASDGSRSATISWEKDGLVFWKVETPEGLSQSKIAILNLLTKQSPVIENSPNDQEALVNQTVAIHWKEPLRATVIIETSENDDFASPRRTIVQPGSTKSELKYSEPRTVYWRLLADYGPTVGMTAPTQARKLVIKPKPLLKAPGKIKARIRVHSSVHPTSWFEQGLDLVFKTIWIEQAMAAEPPRQRPHWVTLDFEWDAVEGAGQYRLQISESEDFSSLLVDRKIGKPIFAYKTEQLAKPRKIYFRVASVDNAGDEGPFGAPEEIDIEALPLPRPALAKNKPKSLEKRPALLTEKERQSRRKIGLLLSLGAAYHSRSFKKTEELPKVASGKGAIPAYLSVEMRLPLGYPSSDPDDASGAAVAFGVSILAEKAEPETNGIKTEAYPIPLLRSWLVLERPFWGELFALGAYATTTQNFNWVTTRQAATERVLALGASAMFLSSRVAPKSWHWRLQLAAVGVGAMGADANASLRHFWKGSPIRAVDHSGLFVESELMFRMLNLETSYGGALKLGYAL